VAVLFISSTGGRATVADEGNTGAPNDNQNNNRTCQTCHKNGSFVVTPQLEITDANGVAVTDNLNGEDTYTVKLTVNSTDNPDGYGFQIVALNAADGIDGSPINTWIVPSGVPNVQVTTTSNGRQYAEQNDLSSSNEFVMEWTAPPSGDVTFYYGANAMNGNGNINGDNAVMATTSISVTPVSVAELKHKMTLDIAPNPLREVLNIFTNAQKSGDYDVMLFDQIGKKVFTEKINIPSGENISRLEIGQLPMGIYSLVLSDGKDSITKKVMKR
ncbi:MAG: choice-of-anchor V domain-containing protein, partial [Bacteroidota bacterium]